MIETAGLINPVIDLCQNLIDQEQPRELCIRTEVNRGVLESSCRKNEELFQSCRSCELDEIGMSSRGLFSEFFRECSVRENRNLLFVSDQFGSDEAKVFIKLHGTCDRICVVIGRKDEAGEGPEKF